MTRLILSNMNTQYSHLFILLVISASLFTNSAEARQKSYPGKLINIGTHRLHIHCIGNGSPSVIIDSGIGGFSLEWNKVQKILANDVRVCSYDRAGYGWSDTGPRPRTTDRIAHELRQLLLKAKIPGPYILVGHSFGGYNTRFFASRYPGLTAGLVLIDSSHHNQFKTEEFKPIEHKPDKNNPKYKNSVTIRMVHPIVSDSFPKENKRLAYRLMSTMKSKSTLINELDNMPISAEQVLEQTNHPPYTFPVTILTRGKRVWPHDEMGERRELQWLRLQNDLQNISVMSKQYLAKNSGHIIHLDEPYFVAENIGKTVKEIRTHDYEFAMARKFNITLPVFNSNDLPQGLNLITQTTENLYKESDQQSENDQIMFNNTSRYFGNHSTYIFH